MLIDSEFNFENHIYSKIKTANKMLANIKRNFQNLDSDSFLMLYKALVRSHLEYAEVIWNPYKIKHKLLLLNRFKKELLNLCHRLRIFHTKRG